MPENIAEPLLKWYDKNKRVLPWRDKDNAYYTWVSEIMLQQTRVEAVKPYFQRFIQELPDVAALAAAPEERIIKLWEGLGYYSRVRNMQKAAVQVMEEYGGRIPEDFETLLSLKGIGRYTAGAIASIAYGKKVPAVDGNVLRVYARLTENRGDIMKQSVRRSVENALTEQMSEDRPGDFNQAMMELGAVVCVPNGTAKCEECPLGHFCLARKHGTVEELPVKAQKKSRTTEQRTVLVIQDGAGTAIRKRPDTGLLAVPVSTLFADGIDYGEYKTNRRIEGMGSAITSFSQKISSGLAQASIGWILGLTGYISGQAVQSGITNMGIISMYAWMPAALLLVIFIILKICYKYEDIADEVINTLENRKKQARN